MAPPSAACGYCCCSLLPPGPGARSPVCATSPAHLPQIQQHAQPQCRVHATAGAAGIAAVATAATLNACRCCCVMITTVHGGHTSQAFHTCCWPPQVCVPPMILARRLPDPQGHLPGVGVHPPPAAAAPWGPVSCPPPWGRNPPCTSLYRGVVNVYTTHGTPVCHVLGGGSLWARCAGPACGLPHFSAALHGPRMLLLERPTHPDQHAVAAGCASCCSLLPAGACGAAPALSHDSSCSQCRSATAPGPWLLRGWLLHAPCRLCPWAAPCSCTWGLSA